MSPIYYLIFLIPKTWRTNLENIAFSKVLLPSSLEKDMLALYKQSYELNKL